MTTLHRRVLLWTPRVLSMLYVVFLSMFALDVFNEEQGFWRILGALTVHLMPSLILMAGLILAWRWEWIGTAMFSAAGLLYIVSVFNRPVSPAIKLSWVLTIAGPAFAIAALFLTNWRNHDELHPHRL